ncbi:MAG: lysophospholipid acyltransferase family protein [Verrucomicrobiales bacterium]|nr:lysophospholipid acyltransferase family protein [Verrucomicrobiales bacterium]
MLHGWFVLVAAGLFFAVGGLVFSCVSPVLYVLLPRRVGHRLGRWLIHWLFRLFLRFVWLLGGIEWELGELEALNRCGPVVIAPNHISLLDAIFVIAKVPQVVCIMKAKIWDNPVLGGGARLAGYIRNDSPGSMVKQAEAQLAAGRHLLVFPEGTRMERLPVNTLKGGFALVAKRAEVPVQTVFLEGSSEFLGKGWNWWRRPVFPLRYRMRLGGKFCCGAGEETKGFVKRIEEHFFEEFSGGVGGE